jgi:acyl dehydratase
MAELSIPEGPLADAVEWRRGNMLEAFEVGQTFVHHWGRTFQAADTVLFSNLCISATPLYFNLAYAEAEGHPDIVVNPWLAFLTVFGLSVEDLSEAGQGAFLGVEDLVFAEPLYPGDTVLARSTVKGIRESASRPDYGIVTWHTVGVKPDGKLALDFDRTNLVIKEEAWKRNSTTTF